MTLSLKPQKNPKADGSPVEWTVTDDGAYAGPYRWVIRADLRATTAPDAASLRLLDDKGARVMEVTTPARTVQVEAAGYGWAVVAVSRGDKLDETPGACAKQWAWVGEVLLYDSSGQVWKAPSDAFELAAAPANIPPYSAADPAAWGISWAPPPTKFPAPAGASLTCYVVNLHAVELARASAAGVGVEPGKAMACTFPLGAPMVWFALSLSEPALTVAGGKPAATTLKMTPHDPSATVMVAPLPAGLSCAVGAWTSTGEATLTFTAKETAAGVYPVTVSVVSTGGASHAVSLAVTVG